jgi:predicted RNase H-like nuclease
VLGVDGCRAGWVGALVGPTGIDWLVLPDARTVLAAAAGAAATGVDIPIGLPACGPRGCDVAARRLLGRRGCTVFPAPVRGVLTADSYPAACAVSRRACGRALSRQAWGLVGRIRDLDDLLPTESNLFEVHPEVSFRLLAGHSLAPKRSRVGALDRLAALSGWRADVPAAMRRLPRGAAGHDGLDALAAAWSAQRWACGQAVVLPPSPERDARGRPMRIVG